MMLQPDTGPTVAPIVAVPRDLLDRIRQELGLRPRGPAGTIPPCTLCDEIDALLRRPAMVNDGKGKGAGDIAWGGGLAEPAVPVPFTAEKAGAVQRPKEEP